MHQNLWRCQYVLPQNPTNSATSCSLQIYRIDPKPAHCQEQQLQLQALQQGSICPTPAPRQEPNQQPQAQPQAPQQGPICPTPAPRQEPKQQPQPP